VSLIMTPEKAQREEFLEVLQGCLCIGKELTTFQLLLKEWFFTCIVFGTMFFYASQVVMLLGLQMHWEYQRRKRQREGFDWEDGASGNLDLDGMTDADSHPGGGPMDSGNRQSSTQEEIGNNDVPHIDERQENQYDDAVFFECDGTFDDGHEDEWEDLPTQTTTTSMGNVQSPNPGATRILDENEE
jgi:hypothetical protein